MPDTTSPASEYNQLSFIGGMNLLGDDTRLQPNQYRIGFNLTNREDELDPVLVAKEDVTFPKGIVQECVTFGKYLVAFVGGVAHFKLYTDNGWQVIAGCSMSKTAPRYWTQAIPVSTTNYIRYASTGVTNPLTSNPAGSIQTASVAGANSGNLPGLVIQDNVNQPQFLFLDVNGFPVIRTIQTFEQWSITYTDGQNIKVAQDSSGVFLDNREYVPIGNTMAYDNGVLYIASQDGNFIYRSVSGRPLDFVVNVVNTLIAMTPFIQYGGGDATTTSYSVGVGGISCLRQLSSGGIFVGASNANFAVTQNKTPGAPTEFGEYTFIRTFLFNANCLTDRAIFDALGDTKFIDLTGVRSFNAIEQVQNEGRNTPFTKTIQAALTNKINGIRSNIIQSPNAVAGILFDNYELFALNTAFGFAIAKFDDINQCWSSFDIPLSSGAGIKILTKIELDVQALFAVTTDNRLFQLYVGPLLATASFRSNGVCANILYANTNIKMNNPKSEIKLSKARVVLNNMQGDATVSFTPYVNNRLTQTGTITKNVKYFAPSKPSSDPYALPDVDTQLGNELFTTPNCGQGWKMFGLWSWTGASITQFYYDLNDVQPMNPLLSQ